MLNYIGLLLKWVEDLEKLEHSTLVLQAHLDVTNDHKRSAWFIAEGEEAAGQLTVWQSGECELEAYRTSDGAEILLEHRCLHTEEDFNLACQTLVDVCEGSEV